MPRMGFSARGANLIESMEVARQLDAAGVDTITVGDDAFVQAAAFATVTKRASLMSCVTLLTRTPVQAVQACSGLDELSGGRFVFGIGVGPADWNRDYHSLDPSRPARRMADYLRSFKAAWHSRPGQPANYEGQIYSIRNYVRMRRSPSENQPVLVGVVGPKNTYHGVRYGDGVIVDIHLERPYVERVTMPAIERGLLDSGKARSDITIAGLFALSVDPDGREARRRARNSILIHIPVDYYWPTFEAAGFGREAQASREALARGDVTGALDAIPLGMVEALTLSGTPDEVRVKARSWDDLVELMVAFPPSFHLPPDEAAWAQRQLLACFLG